MSSNQTPEYRADYYRKNRERILARQKERGEDPEVRAERALYQRAWRNGMTVKQLRQFLADHNHECDICHRPGQVLDHDHTCCGGQTPKIAAADRPKRLCGKCTRGLLCHACNNALGQMRDDPQWLRAAADYLEK